MNAKLSLLAALLLPACADIAAPKASNAPERTTGRAIAAVSDPLPPIRVALDCLPPRAAIVAAHRGTGAGVGAPENSVSGLEALIVRGVLMAEIDVARIADSTLVSFHDGVWDDKASGRGPVVSTSAEDFARMRLRERKNGPVGGEAVPTLDAMLQTAKGRIYLELDMKTSADVGRVVDAVRAAGMTDQVILIASNAAEARTLKALGNEFVLSLPFEQRKRSAGARQGVWVGNRWREAPQDKLAQRHYVLGSQWTRDPADAKRAAARLDIIATDQVLRYDPVEGLVNKAAFEACLAGKP